MKDIAELARDSWKTTPGGGSSSSKRDEGSVK